VTSHGRNPFATGSSCLGSNTIPTLNQS